MVDIESIPDNSSPETPKSEENAEDTETTADGWKKLMGDDLVMKVRRARCPISSMKWMYCVLHASTFQLLTITI
jgi:hypothetical protein